MNSKAEIGRRGEERAIAYLKDMGFTIEDTPIKNNTSPFDILAIKNNFLYAINVKTVSGKKGIFGIQLSNVPGLLGFCKVKNAIPAYILLHGDRFIFLKFDDELSNWILTPEETATKKQIIRKFGNSLGILFDKGSLENVYGLQEGSEVEIDYKFPLIQIKTKSVEATT